MLLWFEYSPSESVWLVTDPRRVILDLNRMISPWNCCSRQRKGPRIRMSLSSYVQGSVLSNSQSPLPQLPVPTPNVATLGARTYFFSSYLVFSLIQKNGSIATLSCSKRKYFVFSKCHNFLQ